ncbi:Uncharacterised protein [uncultured archaeon]|nr:Uncharacterised protein [uncultured archaeon]
MGSKNFLALGALLLLFAGFAAADFSVSSFQVVPSSLVAGSSGVISVTIANTGAYKMEGLTVNTGTDGPISAERSVYIGDLQPGATVTTSIPFQVRQNASAGVYTFTLMITGSYEDPAQNLQTKTTIRNVDIPLTVGSTSIFNLGYGAVTVSNKNPFTVNATIRNFGDPVTNAYVSISSANFIAIGEYPKFLGAVGNETPLALDLALTSDSFNGRDTVNVVLDYTDRLGAQRRATLPLSIYVLRAPEFTAGSVTTSPAKLVSDTAEAQLKVEIQNTGEANGDSISARLVLPQGFTPSYSYSDQATLGTIAQGSSKTAMYYVDVAKGVQGGAYNATMVLSFKDASEEFKTVSFPVEIRVSDAPIFEIVSTETGPASPSAGDTVTMRINIENVGGKPADSVSVRAFSEQSQPFDFTEKSDFIGTLDKGANGTAVLILTVDRDAQPKDYLIDVEIRAVADGNVLVSDEVVRLPVGPSKQIDFGSYAVPAVAGAVLLFGGILAGMAYERKQLGRRE